MSDHDDITALRLRLIANGYSVTPNEGKACYTPGWPSLPMTPEEITSWQARKREGGSLKRFEDTGIRVENGLAVIDLDVDDYDTMVEIANELEAAEPEVAKALIRYGKGAKEAWFVRTVERFGRIATRRWAAPGTSPEDGHIACVEIFGGASPRQFGAFGAHTRGPGGDIEIAYEWADDSPLTVRLDDLPEFTKAQFFKLCDIAEAVLKRRGWQQVLMSKGGEDTAERVYDLTEDMLFDCNDGMTRTLAQLEASAGEQGLRCSAAWLEGPQAVNRSRCIVGKSHSGALTLWETASGVTHMPASRKPVEHEQREIDMKLVAERLARAEVQASEAKQKRLARLTSEDDYMQAAVKLQRQYALCPTQQLQVVPIWAESVDEGMTLTNFRTKMLPWCGVEIGPRGGEKKINPVDLWAASDERVEVAGLRMRPDLPRPLYEEKGKRYVNVYTPASHPAEGGDASVGLEFLTQLLPDAAERAWFTRWLAFKYRHPAIPGPAVVMVARSHGTGRGTLAELVRRLFGARYVKALDFNTFAGKTYQSQYNSWGAETLVVVVNESSDSNGHSLYQGKRDTYERLKDLVEPRPIERHFVRHGLPPFTAKSFTSYIIATNHPDALPLPAEDRRFWVGTNGEPREPAYWEALNAWMEVPENIGAFARWLEELDLADYNPFAEPPMTEGKQAMMEMASSSVDLALLGALDMLPGQLILPEQVFGAMVKIKDENGYEFPDRWEAIARRQLQSRLRRIGAKDGPAWAIKLDNRRYPIYARTASVAARWVTANADERRREILRNGDPTSLTSIAAALSKLHVIVNNP